MIQILLLNVNSFRRKPNELLAASLGREVLDSKVALCGEGKGHEDL